MKPEALARLIAGHVSLHACMAGTRMAAPLLALRDGHSALSVGILLALFSLAQVFLAIPSGRYADRHGLRRPLGLAVVASVLATGLSVVYPVFPVLCLTALVTGGATGAASIALQRHVGRAAHGSTDLKRMFSWLAIGPAVSNFIGPLSAGLLIDHAGNVAGDTTGYRVAFGLMAVLPLAAWYLIRGTPELEPVVREPGAAMTRPWDLLADPMMRRLMLVNWCMSSCWDVHTFVVPVLGHERGFSASMVGTILGAFAISAAGVRVVLPLFAARLTEHVVLTCAMLTTALVFVVYPFMGAASTMGACSVVLGIALGSVQPMVMSTLHQITPEARHGEALGLRAMAINGSSVVMPMLFGTVGTVVGVSVVFWAVGAAVAASARPAWKLRLPEKTAHGAPGKA
ncbi:MAG: MFS transporter [Rhodoferax sp.]|jgi:MFS family permease|nr:MFS transporter [Rhodoferax sp.]